MELENKVKELEEKNRQLEYEKAWETSLTRKIYLMIGIYIIVITYSYVIKKFNNIFLSSLIPVIPFALSNSSLKIIRKIWEKFK